MAESYPARARAAFERSRAVLRDLVRYFRVRVRDAARERAIMAHQQASNAELTRLLADLEVPDPAALRAKVDLHARELKESIEVVTAEIQPHE